MTEREREILALIRANPLISQQSLADRLGISRSAVAGHVMNLTAKGLIKGRGYVLTEAPFAAVIGGANVDIHGSPARALRMRDSNPGTVRSSPGGVARNVAENLARLGVDTRLIAPLGNDAQGDLLEQQGRDAGIDMRCVYRVAGAQTSTYVSVLDDGGDMLVAISDMAILGTLDAERLRAHESMLRQAAVIVLDTNLCDDAVAWLCSAFAGQPLFADTVSVAKASRLRPYLGSIHTLKPSLAEAEAIAGISAATPQRLPGLAAWFHERGVKRLFISLGDGGVFYSTPGGCGLEPPLPADGALRNASGAGDALLAGLVYGWLRDWPLADALRFGMAAAQLTLSYPGTINPDMSVAAVTRAQGLRRAS
ncbi:MAG: PfkB family carbohydrate kinase [Gammaproteobacteria bacterium]|nr:PfkB family carbohydrate kinase [Gammaproteobacteria bacterium]MDH4255132.1 PfkB family carbohydrate kinase [Gammaproteobacteria bacterium]MDH5309834.1 PfkB family carbohydrate kinase [Gammaproteobacteria bacterium]